MCTTSPDDFRPTKLPLFVKTWLNCYYATPKMCVFGQDIGFMVACMVFLYVVRMAWYMVFLCFGWPTNDGVVTTTQEAAACAAGVIHTLNLVPVLGFLLLQKLPVNPSAPMKSYPRWWQDCVDAMMQLCCGHMIHDAVFGILVVRYSNSRHNKSDDGTFLFELNEMDAVYLAHHFVTFFYMMSNRYAGVGQTAGIMCMFFGEFTNPTFNSNLIAQMGKGLECCQGPLAQQITKVIELANAALFVPIRGIAFPVFSTYITLSFFATKSGWKINILLRCIWTLLMWSIVYGSVPFVPEQWNLLVEHFSKTTTTASGQEL